MSKILAVIKKPGEEPYVDHIENELHTLQELVGGYIETVTLATDLVLIVNEEGVIKNLPYNAHVAGYPFYGTIVAVGTKGEEFASLRSFSVPAVLTLLGGRK